MDLIFETLKDPDPESVNKLSDTIFKNINKYKHEEYQYLNLIENILENGVWEEGRNGKTKSIFGQSMRFSLKDGKIPILTTKRPLGRPVLKNCYGLFADKLIIKY